MASFPPNQPSSSISLAPSGNPVMTISSNGAMGLNGTYSTTIQASSTHVKMPNGEQIPLESIVSSIQEIKDRLLIIDPVTALHDKYPDLKDAYDHYMIIKKLVEGD